MVVVVFALLAPRTRADDVELKGGTKLVGTILAQTDTHVRLLTPKGSELKLAKADIAAIRKDADAPRPGEWVRFRRKGKYGGDLQVAVVHMLAPDGRRVDLLSAVHIADPAYWTIIRQHLETAEVVLFELIKPRGVSAADVLRRRRESGRASSGLQAKLARWFHLEFQLDAINYDRPHFIHADVETEQHATQKTKLPKELAPLKLMLDQVGPYLDKFMGDDNDPKAVRLRKQYKNVSARVLGTLGSRAAVLFGPRLKKALIDDRNAIVAKRLAELPPHHRNVTIFYGAAHMKDIEERLTKAGYKRAGGRWINAWDVPD